MCAGPDLSLPYGLYVYLDIYICVKGIHYLFVFPYMLRLIKKRKKSEKKIVHKNNIDIHLSVDVVVCVSSHTSWSPSVPLISS